MKDIAFDASNTNKGNVNFNAGTGVYTTPFRAAYHCCASFRCRQGGVCDFTVIRNTNAGSGDVRIGAFGTRNTVQSNLGWFV